MSVFSKSLQQLRRRAQGFVRGWVEPDAGAETALQESPASPLVPGVIIENRYRIESILGQGGFGRAYLATDQRRFDEPCVLKEFIAPTRDSQFAAKARELFQREANVLYRLRHSQIPNFHALLQVELGPDTYLLFAQQYVKGPTYLEQLQQFRHFDEQEVIVFLSDLLPVLAYIHREGVIHRDISPDNLIQDQETGKPILIDFGAVKQIAFTVTQQLTGRSPTILGKKGYTPEEQRRGIAYPSSDLYALAVTALVLLTGQKPADLYDEYHGDWRWAEIPNLSPALAKILKTMLQPQPDQRYQSAKAVIRALKPLKPSKVTSSHQRSTSVNRRQSEASLPSPQTPDPLSASQPAGPVTASSSPVVTSGSPIGTAGTTAGAAYQPLGQHPLSDMPTLRIAPGNPLPTAQPAEPAAQPVQPAIPSIGQPGSKTEALATPGQPPAVQPDEPPATSPRQPPWFQQLGQKIALWLLIRAGLVGVAGLLIWFGVRPWAYQQWAQLKARLPGSIAQNQNCQERVLSRYQSAGEPPGFYTAVDTQFYAENPELEGRALSDSPTDAPYRQEWCAIANDWLNQQQ